MRIRGTVPLLAALLLGICGSAAANEGQESTEPCDQPGLWQRFLTWRAERTAITDTLLVTSQGGGYAPIQDTRMSPLLYHAPAATLVFEDRTYRPREIVLFAATGHFAFPLTEDTRSGREQYLNLRGTVDAAYQRRIAELDLYGGGSLSFTANQRLYTALSNSSFNFDLIASANAALRWDEAFTLFERPASWHLQAIAPTFSWVLRSPAYGVQLSGDQSIWAFPWRFYRLRLNVGITSRLKHSLENRIAIDYRYDFYGMRDQASGHSLSLGVHAITLGFALKTK